MKIKYGFKFMTRKEKVVYWLNFFEYELVKKGHRGDIYKCPYSERVIIVKRGGLGIRYFQVSTREGRPVSYCYQTKTIDLNAISTIESLCKTIITCKYENKI